MSSQDTTSPKTLTEYVFNKCMQALLCFCKKLETVGSKHIFVDVAFMKLD